MTRFLLLASAFLLLAALDSRAAAAGGPTGDAAPKWEVASWANLPAGRESLEVTDLRGRVICLFNFQSW